MTASESCRKRRRSEEEDCDDCLPISKRITKLHIRYEGRISGEDCLEPLLTDNNNVSGTMNGMNCCQPQSWCDHPSGSTATAVPGPSASQLSPIGPTGPPVGPSSPPWQGQYSPPSIPASSQLINLPGTGSLLHNELPVGPSAIMPISHNLLSMPGGSGCDHSELVCTGPDQYDPELSKEDNPHYYQMNQVLYYAHMSRLQRQGRDPSTFQ